MSGINSHINKKVLEEGVTKIDKIIGEVSSKIKSTNEKELKESASLDMQPSSLIGRSMVKPKALNEIEKIITDLKGHFDKKQIEELKPLIEKDSEFIKELLSYKNPIMKDKLLYSNVEDYKKLFEIREQDSEGFNLIFSQKVNVNRTQLPRFIKVEDISALVESKMKAPESFKIIFSKNKIDEVNGTERFKDVDNLIKLTNLRETNLESFDFIFNVKNQSGEYVFNNADEYNILMNLRESNKEVFDNIVTGINSVKNYFRTAEDYNGLINLREKKPEQFDKIFEKIFKSENMQPVPFINEVEDFESLINAREKNPKLIDTLLSMKTNNAYNISQYRFNQVSDYEHLADLNKNHSESFGIILNAKNEHGYYRFNNLKNIDENIILRDQNPDTFDMLMNARIDSKADSDFRFHTSDIKELMELRTKDSEYFDKLYNEKIISENGIERYKYDSLGIKGYMETRTFDPETFDMLEKMTVKNADGNLEKRFNFREIQRLIKTRKEDKESFDKILHTTFKNENGEKVLRFESYADIINFSQLRTSNPELFDNIMEVKTLEGSPRFKSLYEFESLIDIGKDSPKTFKEILNKKCINEKGEEIYRFNSISDIKQLLALSKENEKLYDSVINDMVNNQPRFDNICNFIGLYNKNKDIVTKMVLNRTSNGEFKYSLNDITNFVELYETRPDLVNKLLSLNVKNIKATNDVDYIQKQLAHYDYMIASGKKDTDISLNIIDDPYVENAYRTVSEYGDTSTTHFFKINNGKPEPTGIETVRNIGNKSQVKHEFPDGTYSVQEMEYGGITQGKQAGKYIVGQKTSFWNNEGICIRSEVIKPSVDVAGSHTITVYERGLNQPMKKKEIGTVQTYGSQKQGSKSVRNLKSEDGSTTTHTIIKGPKGSGMDYIIKDKGGKTLFKSSRRHRFIDENHTTSSLNGQKYDMKFSSNTITVSKLDNNGKPIETITIGDDILEPQLMNLYKQLPGDYFFTIKQLGLKRIEFAPDIFKNNAGYVYFDNKIVISQELKDNPFVFSHELGHAIDDIQLKLNEDKNLKKIFDEELKNYKKTTSDTEGHAIDYFTVKSIEGDELRGLKETIAETQALTSGLYNTNMDALATRSIVLQQHFPQTISYIANKLNNVV